MTGRRTGRTLLVGGLLLTLLASGCGVWPSGVITGRSAVSGPSSQGVVLYLLSQDELVLTLRPAKVDPSPAEALALLAAGPDENERGNGFTSEVPAGLVPVKVAPGVDRSGLAVTTSGAAQPLSANAVDQIVCTVADVAARTGLAESFVPVTIVGSDGARQPRRCPLQ
ncbi:hypothetical protein [Micromonospora sp. NPDC005413]|uniref:hypothetical protein n=1 Tax=Micromonospora sp. NPDC005413 TaxID=3154563 RepID=UPI0033A49D47